MSDPVLTVLTILARRYLLELLRTENHAATRDVLEEEIRLVESIQRKAQDV